MILTKEQAQAAFMSVMRCTLKDAEKKHIQRITVRQDAPDFEPVITVVISAEPPVVMTRAYGQITITKRGGRETYETADAFVDAYALP